MWSRPRAVGRNSVPIMTGMTRLTPDKIIELTPHQKLQVCVVAKVDPRTFDGWLRRKRGASTCAARIEAALEELGFAVAAE